QARPQDRCAPDGCVAPPPNGAAGRESCEMTLTKDEDSNRPLLRARDGMDGSSAEPLDIPALARIALTSPAHFSRTFRDTFGETPHRYLQRRRVERAMFLLWQTDRSIT